MATDSTSLPLAAEPGRRRRALARFVPYVVVVAIADTLIAIMLTAASQGDGFVANFVYSQCIGLSILLLIVLPRLLWPPAGQPAAWRTALQVTLGVLVGFVGGSLLASLLLGVPPFIWTRDAGNHRLLVGFLVTLLASAGCTSFFWLRERVASLTAEASAARERAEAERARAEAASRQATEAQLNLIRTQLEPHMLFNTLANLRSLMVVDPRRAQVMVDHLIDFLRATLAASRHDMVALRDEFEVVRDYLALIAIRMGDRLDHSLELPEPLAGAAVLPMLLQPLVENAVRHGIEPSIEGGRIDVSARAEGDMLIITVEDSGMGFDAPAHAGGFGLSQVRERLATAYGDRAALEIESPRGDDAPGTRVRLKIPLARTRIERESRP